MPRLDGAGSTVADEDGYDRAIARGHPVTWVLANGIRRIYIIFLPTKFGLWFPVAGPGSRTTWDVGTLGQKTYIRRAADDESIRNRGYQESGCNRTRRRG